MNKIIVFKDLSKLIKDLKTNHTVLVGGCFDILHFGHVRFLKQAAKYGTLLVALESDENLKRYKGLSRPIHNQKQRAEVLAELESVDYVLLLPTMKSDQEYYDLTKTVSPDIIAITEGDPLLVNKQKQAKSVAGKVVIIPKIKTPSTSTLIKLLKLESN